MAVATVLYLMEAGGNLGEKLPQLANQLDSLRAKAATTGAGIGRGIADGVAAARQAVNSIAEEGKQALEGFAKAGAVLAGLAIGADLLLERNDAFAESTARLKTEVGSLAQAVADQLGPSAAGFVDNFSLGLVYIVTLLQNVVEPAIMAVGHILDAVKAGMVEWVTFAKAILSGDFAGAVQSIRDTQVRQLGDLQAAMTDVVAGVQQAHDLAISAAKGTFERQNDGISDRAPTVKVEWSDEAKAFQPVVRSLEGLAIDMTSVQPALEKAVGSADDMVAGLESMEAAVAEWVRQAKAQAAVQGTSDVLNAVGTGDLATVAGQIGGMAAGGPIGALIGAVVGIAPAIDETVFGLIGQLHSFMPDVADAVTALLQGLPTVIGTIIPEMVGQVPLVATQLASAFVSLLAPLMWSLAVELPVRIGIEVVKGTVLAAGQWFNELPRMIADGFLSIWGLIQRDVREILHFDWGTDLKGPDKSLFGIKLPSFDSGGVVGRSGLVWADAGERFLGAPGSAGAARSSGGGPVINLNGPIVAPDVRRFADELRRSLGSTGIGISLDSFVTGGT